MRNSLSTILMSTAFLCGCDSGTQSCLDSERIKAELARNLQEEMELEARLSALSNLDGKLAEHLAGTRAWIKSNPQPKGSPVRPVPLRSSVQILPLDWKEISAARDMIKRWVIIKGQKRF